MIKSIKDLEKQSKDGSPFIDTKDQLRDYVYNLSSEAFKRGDLDRDNINNVADLKKRQEFVKDAFINSIGGLPNSDTPLNAKIIGTLHFDTYKIEKIIFNSRPDVYVTANMYIPNNITKPSATVMFVSGHHSKAKHQPEYQRVCQYLVNAGLIVFAQDPIGQGERYSYYDEALKSTIIPECCAEHDYAGFQCIALGQGLTRYFLHDIMRGIDYLCTRNEVDNNKIGITGNSGGGTQTSIVMLADRRISVAVPCTFIMNRETYQKTGQAQDREQIWRGLTELGIDHEDILLSMAPKPVKILSVQHDFFPIEATERTFHRCKKYWEFTDNSDLFEMFTDDSDHNYTDIMAEKAAIFFAKHLLNKEIDKIDSSLIKEIKPSKLWCTKSGQVQGEIKKAKIIFDENQIELKNIAISKNKKEDVIKFLKKVVFKNRSNFPLHVKKDLPTYYLNEHMEEELTCDSILWYSQKDILNHAYIFKSIKNKHVSLPVTICLWEDGTQSLDKHYEFIKETCNKDRAVMVIDLVGMGMMSQRDFFPIPNTEFYGVIFKLNDDMLWLNDSICALRIYELLRSLDVLSNFKELSNIDTQIYTYDRYNVYADCARLLDNRIKNITSVNPLISYADFIKSKYYNKLDIASIILPDLIKYADLDKIRKL